VPQTPLGPELTVLPDPLAGFKGPILLRGERGGERTGRGREGKGGEGRGRDWSPF